MREGLSGLEVSSTKPELILTKRLPRAARVVMQYFHSTHWSNCKTAGICSLPEGLSFPQNLLHHFSLC